MEPFSDGCDILREDDGATFKALHAAQEWEKRRKRGKAPEHPGKPISDGEPAS